MKRNRNRARSSKNQVIVQKMQSRIYCLVLDGQGSAVQDPENSRVRIDDHLLIIDIYVSMLYESVNTVG